VFGCGCPGESDWTYQRGAIDPICGAFAVFPCLEEPHFEVTKDIILLFCRLVYLFIMIVFRFVDTVLARQTQKVAWDNSSSPSLRTKRFGTSDESITTGWAVQMQMTDVSECGTSGPTAMYINGQGLGTAACEFWSQSGNTVTYADTTCTITSDDTCILVTNQYSSVTCSGSPTKSSDGNLRISVYFSVYLRGLICGQDNLLMSALLALQLRLSSSTSALAR
jgi:hypothetical protein